MESLSPSSGRLYRQYRIEIKANYTHPCCHKKVINRKDIILYEFGPKREPDNLLYEPYTLADVVFARRTKKSLYVPDRQKEIENILKHCKTIRPVKCSAQQQAADWRQSWGTSNPVYSAEELHANSIF